MKEWYQQTKEEILGQFQVTEQGLTSFQAEKILAEKGENVLEEGKRKSTLQVFLEQFCDLLVVILIIAALISMVSGNVESTVVILAVIILNAILGTVQHAKAEKSLDSLKSLSSPSTKVMRDGHKIEVPSAQVVPGDILYLEAGDLVPADARVLEAHSLKADESSMTGESVPVSKEACGALPADTPLGDRRNMLLSATVITGGNCTCVVTGTGMDTEVGRIAGMLMEEGDGETPLQRKMAEISKTLSFVCLCVCAVMFGVGLLQGKELLDMFMTAVSLAVAAIPEGLPAIVTIVLALGVQRMVKRGAIVKRLPAVAVSYTHLTLPTIYSV